MFRHNITITNTDPGYNITFVYVSNDSTKITSINTLITQLINSGFTSTNLVCKASGILVTTTNILYLHGVFATSGWLNFTFHRLTSFTGTSNAVETFNDALSTSYYGVNTGSVVDNVT